LVCPKCRDQTTRLAGAIVEKARSPLMASVEAAWHVKTTKYGSSSKCLERTQGTWHRRAWIILQRFRLSMVRTERLTLSGNAAQVQE